MQFIAFEKQVLSISKHIPLELSIPVYSEIQFRLQTIPRTAKISTGSVQTIPQTAEIGIESVQTIPRIADKSVSEAFKPFRGCPNAVLEALTILEAFFAFEPCKPFHHFAGARRHWKRSNHSPDTRRLYRKPWKLSHHSADSRNPYWKRSNQGCTGSVQTIPRTPEGCIGSIRNLHQTIPRHPKAVYRFRLSEEWFEGFQCFNTDFGCPRNGLNASNTDFGCPRNGLKAELYLGIEWNGELQRNVF